MLDIGKTNDDFITVYKIEWDDLVEENERMGNALNEILNWCNAYPLEVFPEPDFKRVRELLEAGGITIDSVSASNMRHVVEGVRNIAEKGLSHVQ